MTISEENRKAHALSRHHAGCTQLVTKEKQRYQRKGYGLIVATLIVLSFFFGVPYLAKKHWPAIMNFADQKDITYNMMYLGINIALHNVIHIGANLVYWVFYRYEFQFIERYKSNEEPWPWHEDPEGWRRLVIKAIFVLLFNGNVLVLLVYLPLTKTGLMEQHSTSSEHVPSPLVLASSIFFFMVCEDFTFYWCHRLLHYGPFYRHVHKMHHTFKTTVGIAAEYTHPIEFVLGNMLPCAVGPAILGPRAHIITIFAWYTIRFGETLDGHCGYEFSWSPFRLIPFSGSADYHDFHHSANIGNYSSFFCIWDTVFGTNKDYYKHLEERTLKRD
jgi:sterol desaturase/sphingolipid hydroxylase (fatty acid hydroxylase superfamily)